MNDFANLHICNLVSNLGSTLLFATLVYIWIVSTQPDQVHEMACCLVVCMLLFWLIRDVVWFPELRHAICCMKQTQYKIITKIFIWCRYTPLALGLSYQALKFFKMN